MTAKGKGKIKFPKIVDQAKWQKARDALLVKEKAATRARDALAAEPPPAHKVFIPSRNGELLRQALIMKMRSIKLMSLMALGPYPEPLPPASGAVWAPSIAY